MTGDGSAAEGRGGQSPIIRLGGRSPRLFRGIRGFSPPYRHTGDRVERPEELPGAVARAFANRPALLDVVVTPEAVSSDAKTGLARVPDLQPLAAWDEAERKWRAQ
jgi:hypothetical protein